MQTLRLHRDEMDIVWDGGCRYDRFTMGSNRLIQCLQNFEKERQRSLNEHLREMCFINWHFANDIRCLFPRKLARWYWDKFVEMT